MRLPTDLLAKARAWADADPDVESRAELEALIAEANEAELADRFAMRLEFGTAGLRGVIGAGPNRMNRAVVIMTSRSRRLISRGTAGRFVAMFDKSASRGGE